MIDTTIKEFDKRTTALVLEMKEIRKEISDITNKAVQKLTVNIGIMVSIITIVSAILHFGFHP